MPQIGHGQIASAALANATASGSSKLSRRLIKCSAARLAERPDTFAARVVPVDPAAVDRVDLLVGRGTATTRYTVEYCAVSVGPVRLRLSELRRLELDG